MHEPTSQTQTPTRPLRFRDSLRPGDEAAVAAIVGSTEFFSPAEQAIAVELVAERREKGDASGYHFVFLEQDSRVLGYSCFGPIPATVSSYDLYWIAVDGGSRGGGLGCRLLARTERAIAARTPASRIYVDTSSRPAYASTRAFYQRNGYRKAAELPGFYAPGDGKIIYQKSLVP